MSDSERAALLFLWRWRELVSPHAYVGRLARTLSARAVVEEAARLADSHLRAGGRTRAAADPSEAGHGIAMLPDVIDEADAIVSKDYVLKKKRQEVQRDLCQIFKRIKDARQKFRSGEVPIPAEDVSLLQACAEILEKTYLVDALDCLDELLTDGKHLLDVEAVCGALVSDVRSRGWTDPGLLELLAPDDTADHIGTTLKRLRATLTAPPRTITCYVPVSFGSLDRARLVRGGIPHCDVLPRPTEGSPAPEGPFVIDEVVAQDERHAALLARARIASILGALAIFVPGEPSVKSSVVVVERAGCLVGLATNEPVRAEKRGAQGAEIERVLSSAVRGSAGSRRDPVFEAIRCHERATRSQDDPETRFMLLWSGIERLLLGTPGCDTILTAARTTVPKSITMRKLSREIGALAAALDREMTNETQRAALHELVGSPQKDGRIKVDRRKLLERLLGDEERSRALTGVIRETHVHLGQWYFALRSRLEGHSEGQGRRIAVYLEESCRRVEWHVLRLYRARNSVAHGGYGPIWLRDLIHHAHYYLTQLIAIVLHQRDVDPWRAPSEILLERARQYDLYVMLLRNNFGEALAPEALLRPSQIVRDAGGST